MVLMSNIMLYGVDDDDDDFDIADIYGINLLMWSYIIMYDEFSYHCFFKIHLRRICIK